MRSRGFVLVLALLLLTLLLLLGLAQLNARTAEYRAVRQSNASAQALALAEAGMEDARVKLNRDSDFPPQGADDQAVFSYREVVMDLDDATPLGCYVVTVDMRWLRPPAQILRVTSEGQSGPLGRPSACRRITQEWDMARNLRSGGGSNPDYFLILHREDEGAY